MAQPGRRNQGQGIDERALFQHSPGSELTGQGERYHIGRRPLYVLQEIRQCLGIEIRGIR